MLADASKPIMHRLSKFLTPTSKSKFDHIPKSSICYEGVGLGIFAALDRSEKYATNNQIAITRLYFDEKVVSKCTRNSDQMMMKKKPSIFSLRVEEEFEEFHGMEFLSCCNLCRKKLYGKDIYMYRGEKAFCSEECREVHITRDERKEGYRSYGFADVGASSCPASRQDPMVSTGIFAI